MGESPTERSAGLFCSRLPSTLYPLPSTLYRLIATFYLHRLLAKNSLNTFAHSLSRAPPLTSGR